MRVSSAALVCAVACLNTSAPAAPAGSSAPPSAPATLVRDIETTFDPTVPPWGHQSGSTFARVGGVTYFFAADDLHGRELWRSEGTDDTTRRVTDLCPGPCAYASSQPVAAGSALYFWADDGASGVELWRSDGTAAGTRRAPEFCVGSCGVSGLSSGLHPVGERVFLSLVRGESHELWVSDGTASGHRVVLTAQALPHVPFEILGSLGERLLFELETPALGRELWWTDGTPEGTALVGDLCPGPTSSFVQVLATTQSGALLRTGNCTIEPAYWVLDPSGHVESLINPSAFPIQFGVSWDERTLLLGAGPEIVRLDLVSRSGLVLANVAPPTTSPQPIGVPAVSGGRALFSAESDGFGVEPWITDGSVAGTRRLADLVSGPGSSMQSSGSHSDFVASGDGFLFRGLTVETGMEPWFTDGSIAGTRSLGDLAPGPLDSFPSFAGGSPSLMFTYSFLKDGQSYARLFFTDGTAAGTEPAGSPAYRVASSSPHRLTALATRLAFAATTTAHGVEPWRSDGTAVGTQMIADTAPGYNVVGEFTRFRNRWVFGSGVGLWTMRGDGRQATTIAGAEIAGQFVPLKSGLFFSAVTPGGAFGLTRGVEPFFWRGGDSSAFIVRDLFPGMVCSFRFCSENASAPRDSVPAGGGAHVFFGATDGVAGREPWISDGTSEGTRMLGDLCPGGGPAQPLSSDPHDFVGFNDGSAIAIADGDCAPRLIRLRPDSAPEVLLGDVGELHEIKVFGLRVYFFVRRGGGDELWWQSIVDGSHGRVRRLWQGGNPGVAQELTVSGSRLFFRVVSDRTGEELWTSDGTAAGTRLLEILPGPRGAAPRSLTSIDGQLVFSASDGRVGAELWVSDGTRAGTRRIQDIATGSDASSPAEFTLLGDRVYFAAGDAAHGRELWSISRSALRLVR